MRPLRHLEPLQDAVRQFRKRRATTGVILMYHRVLPSGVDVWRLSVSPAHFSEQLAVLRSRAHPVALRSFVADIRSGRVGDRSVAVTFDDGYANNLELGVPALEAFDIPATVFVATGYTGGNREFWWDELEQLVVHGRALPARLELAVGAWRRQWDTGTAAEPGQDLSGTASSALPGTRLALYHDIWLALRTLPHATRRGALDQIGVWSRSATQARSTHRAMTADEVSTMAAHPLMEIGAHTVTHPHMTEVPASAQRSEVLESKARLEQIVNGPITSFSYPFGGWAPSMRPMVQTLGLESAATCVEQTVWRRSNPFSLPRFMVQDWDGAEFERRLSDWFSSH